MLCLIEKGGAYSAYSAYSAYKQRVCSYRLKDT
jgi:hypothetical protein